MHKKQKAAFTLSQKYNRNFSDKFKEGKVKEIVPACAERSLQLRYFGLKPLKDCDYCLFAKAKTYLTWLQ